MTEKLKLSLTLADLSLDDLEAFEDATGLDLLEEVNPKPVINPETRMPVKDPDDPRGRPLLQVKISTRAYNGMIFLAWRRLDPSKTFADVKKLKLSEFDFTFQIAEVEPAPLALQPELPLGVPQNDASDDSGNGSPSPDSTGGPSATSAL